MSSSVQVGYKLHASRSTAHDSPVASGVHSKGHQMFEKNGKFYADWRDTSGTRLRKSFASKRAALQYEAEMKEQAHPKQKARGIRSARSSALNTSGSAPATQSTKSPNASSRKLVHSRRKNSAPPTSPKSTTHSPAPVTPIRRAPTTRTPCAASSAGYGKTTVRRSSINK